MRKTSRGLELDEPVLAALDGEHNKSASGICRLDSRIPLSAVGACCFLVRDIRLAALQRFED